MAVDFKARLAKLKAERGEGAERQRSEPPAEAPKKVPDFKGRLNALKNAAKPPEGAQPGRFPSTQQRAGMDRMGSAEQRVGDLAGGLNTALFDVIDLPSTVYNLGAEVTGNEEFKVPPTMSALRPFVADRTEAMENADNPVQDFMRTFAEWGGGVGTMQRGVSKAADTAIAGGAATGEAVGGETGELVGGFSSAFLPATWNKLFGDVDSDAKLREVVEFIRNTTGEEGVQRLRQGLRDGEAGTVGDLSRNQEANTVEVALANERPQAADAFRESADARAAQVGEQFDSTLAPAGVNTPVPRQQAEQDIIRNRERVIDAERSMQGGATEANRATLARSRAAEEAARAEAQQARQASQDADAAIGGEMRTDQASARLAEEYRNLDKDLREQVVRPAWEKFEEVKEFETQQLQQDLSDFSEDMPSYLREDLNRQYKTLMNKLQNMEDIADPRDIQYVLSSIKQANREARATNTFGPLNKQLGEVQNIVDNALASGERIGPRFQDAVAATLEQKTRMGGKKGGDALAKADDSPETFVDSFGGFKGNKGANAVARIKASERPEVEAAAAEALRSELRRTDISEKTLTDYEAALDAFPKVKDDITTAVANRQTLKEVEDTAKEVATRESAVQKEADTLLTNSINKIRTKADGTRGKIKNLTMSKFAAKPNAFIDSAIKETDDSGDLGRLYNKFAKQGKQYGEAFKSKVLGRLKEDIMDANKVDGKLADRIQRLMDNGIITDANRQEVIDIIGMQEGRRQRRLVKSAGRSKLDPQGEGQKTVDDLTTTAATLPVLSALPSSHQLMAAGMLKRTFGKIIRSKRLDPERLKKLTELMNNPQRLQTLMDGKITKNTKPEELSDIFGRAFVRAGILSGQLDDE